MLQITPVERVLLQLLADGRTAGQIASRLRLRESDVEERLAALFAMMRVATATEAVDAALRRGIVAVASGRRPTVRPVAQPPDHEKGPVLAELVAS